MNNNLTPAATVLVLRDSKDEMEVLMVKRSKKPPFGNLYVFPGGKIDNDDHLKELENYSRSTINWVGRSDTETIIQSIELIGVKSTLEKISGKDLEIISIHIREALKSLDSITRETDNEEVLGIIFGKFCIGK